MKNFLYTKKSALFRKVVSCAVAAIFTLGLVIMPAAPLRAQYVSTLPKAGEMVLLSPKFEPAVLQGLTLNPNNPLQFDFLVDRGEVELPKAEFKEESQKLVKYFLAAMTIPDNDSWVNLSPYESDRIIPDLLASTEMGKQMLEQDYLLKQLSASLTNPEKELGKKFWDTVHKRAFEKFGTSELPMNTFNKVWIVPEKAVVVELDGYALITESRLKVMIAEDYEALQKSADEKNSQTQKNTSLSKTQSSDIAALSSQIVKEIIIPELEKEVNEGKNFAPVRQIYRSVILAAWYKKTLKETLLGKVYMDKGKIKGVDIPEKDVKQKVYAQYVDAFRRGVYNLIQEDEDSVSRETLPRKYFSGGVKFGASSALQVISLSEDLRVELDKFITGFRNLPGKPASEDEIPSITKAILNLITRYVGTPDFAHQTLAETLAKMLVKNNFGSNPKKDTILRIVTVIASEKRTEEDVLINALRNSEESLAIAQAEDVPAQTMYTMDGVNTVAVLDYTGKPQTIKMPANLAPYEDLFNKIFANNSTTLWLWLNKTKLESERLEERLLKEFYPATTAAALAELYTQTMAAGWISPDSQERQILMQLIHAIEPEQYSQLNEILEDTKDPFDNQTFFITMLADFLSKNTEGLVYAAKILGIANQPIPSLYITKQFKDGSKVITLYNPSVQIDTEITQESPTIVMIFPAEAPPQSYAVLGSLDSTLSSFESAQKMGEFFTEILNENNPNSVLPGQIINLDHSYAQAKARSLAILTNGNLNPSVESFFTNMYLYELTTLQQTAKETFTQNPSAENALKYLDALFTNPLIVRDFNKSFPAQNQKEFETKDNGLNEIAIIPSAANEITILLSSVDKNGTTIPAGMLTLQGTKEDFPNLSNLDPTEAAFLIDLLNSRKDLSVAQKTVLFQTATRLTDEYFEMNIDGKLKPIATKMLALLPNNDGTRQLDTANGQFIADAPSTQEKAKQILTDPYNQWVETTIKRNAFIKYLIEKLSASKFSDLAEILNFSLPNGNVVRHGRGFLMAFDDIKNITTIKFDESTIELQGNWMNYSGFDSTLTPKELADIAKMIPQNKALSDSQMKMLFNIYIEIATADIKSRPMRIMFDVNGINPSLLPPNQRNDLTLAVNKKINAPETNAGEIIERLFLLNNNMASSPLFLTNPLTNDVVIIQQNPDGSAKATISGPDNQVIETLNFPGALYDILKKNPNLTTASEFLEWVQLVKNLSISKQQKELLTTILTRLDIVIKQDQANRELARDADLRLTREIESLSGFLKSIGPLSAEIKVTINLLLTDMQMPDYNSATKEERSRQIINDITTTLSRVNLNDIAWALGINTVKEQRTDKGTIEIRYDYVTNTSTIQITPMWSFGPGETVSFAFKDNWLAPNLRMSISPDLGTQRLIDLYNAVSSYAGNLSAAEQFTAFQVLDKATSMDVYELEKSKLVARGAKLYEIARVVTDAEQPQLIPNLNELIIREPSVLVKQKGLIPILGQTIQANPSLLPRLAQAVGVSSTPLEPLTANASNVGGIDFNPNLLDLQIKRNGRGVPLPLPMQNIDKINIEGLYPVILNISPARIENLPFLMGTKPKPQTDKLSLAK